MPNKSRTLPRAVTRHVFARHHKALESFARHMFVAGIQAQDAEDSEADYRRALDSWMEVRPLPRPVDYSQRPYG